MNHPQRKKVHRRKANPYESYFTYHNADNTIHNSLDRIYITKKIKITNFQIIPTSISDHDSVSTIIQVNKKEPKGPKGPGIWKLNTTILKYKHFQKTFKQFWNSWTKEKTKYNNYNDWWGIGKMYFKNMAMIIALK